MITRRQALGALAAIPVVLKTGVVEAAVAPVSVPEIEFEGVSTVLELHVLDGTRVFVVSGPRAMDMLHSSLMENSGTPWFSSPNVPLPDFDAGQKALRLLGDSVIRHTEVPPGVSVCVLPTPVGLVPHPKTGEPVVAIIKEHILTAQWRPEVIQNARGLVGIDVAERNVEIVGEQIGLQLTAEMKQAVAEHGQALFVFYTLPARSKTFYEPTDFVPRKGLSMRYTKVV